MDGRRRWMRSMALAALTLLAASNSAEAGAEDWNDAKIQWRNYEQGLSEAKKSGKPVCLIFYTTWCPHCANYSRVFQDPKVVERSRDFVMIRVDADKRRDLSDGYKPDGAYVPRSFFLSPQGVLDPEINAGREQYKFFYHEHDPGHILKAMEVAAQKYRQK